MNFGLQQEEYRLAVELPSVHLTLGDGIYALTKLTGAGRYGRGAGADVRLGPLEVRSFAFQSLNDLPGYRRTEKVVRVGVSPASALAFGLNYSSFGSPAGASGEAASLHSRFSSQPLAVTAEYAVGRTGGPSGGETDRALWIDGGGRLGPAGYQATYIRGGANFPGAYGNLDYASIRTSLRLPATLQWLGSFSERTIRSRSDLYVSSIFNRSVQTGFQARPFKGLGLSFEWTTEDRRDLSPDFGFDYRDETLRLGFVTFGRSLQLQGAVDVGRTRNHLTGRTAALREYSGSANFRPSSGFAVGAQVHYRDQERGFTGETLQTLDLRLDASLKFGRTEFEAYYRTSFRREFTPGLYDLLTLNDPFLMAHRLDTVEASLAHRFRNGHALAVRFRGSSPLDGFKVGGGALRHVVAGLEYTIPVRLPLARRTDVAKLHGRIADGGPSGPGLADVLVRANNLAVLTNAQGEFFFHGVKPDTYFLSLDQGTIPPGRVSLRPTPLGIAVEPGAAAKADIALVRPASVSGRIGVYRQADDPTGQGLAVPGASREPAGYVESSGLANALLELKSETETLIQVADGEGRFRFEDVRPGAWTLLAFGDALPEFTAFESDTVEIEIEPGEQKDVRFRVLPRRREIRIKDGGRLVAGGREISPPAPLPSSRASDKPPASDKGRLAGAKLALQAGVFSTLDRAQRFALEIAGICPTSHAARHDLNGRTYYRVLISCSGEEQALEFADRLGRRGIEVVTAKNIILP